MKQGLFKRIFILYGVIFLLTVLITELYVTEEIRTNTISNLRDNLSIQAALISRDVPFQSASQIDGLCKQFKEMTGARVTIIALNGRVIGDSDHDSSGMDNHSDRIEVQQAMLNGSGMIIRKNDTLKEDLLYVAQKIVQGSRLQGFIRLSVPLRDVDAAVNLLRIRILLFVGLVLLATGLLPLWNIIKIRTLTTKIRDFSSSLARGDPGKRLFIDQAGEFDDIADSLNTMSADLIKRTEASEEEKRRINLVLRSVPDAMLIIDANGVILLSNLAASKLFGGVALQGRRYIEVVRDKDFLSLMETVQKEQTTGSIELKIDAPHEQYFMVRVSPLFYEERRLSGMVVVFHDITRLWKLEQTRKDFVANVSHELKTPITAIKGFAETLLDGALDDKTRAVQFVEIIRANSERINSLVDDLMTISKLELGVITVEKTPVNVKDIMEQVIASLGNKASDKGLALKLSISPEVREIDADRNRLLQILTNLVDNAIKFTETGGVTIGAAWENNRTILFVEDAGIGVPRTHLERLGERFYRVDPGRSRNMGGTGLGLAIVKHLVKAHGWDMRIDSTPGKGTKVWIFLTDNINR